MMFFNYKWENRIKRLENQVVMLLSERACSKGQHEWQMREASALGFSTPYVRCKHCYAAPISTSKSKSKL